MILDTYYDKYKKILTISYVNENGLKSFMEFNVSVFKTFQYDLNGEFQNWDGSRASMKYTDRPSQFDIMYFILNLEKKYQDILNAPNIPLLYTYDIETEFDDEFPDPNIARHKVTTTSIASTRGGKFSCIALGTKVLSNEQINSIQSRINKHMDTCDFFKNDVKKYPEFKYLKFETEKDMLEFFLSKIVAKAPVVAGWNSDGFDWNYISNRVKKEYPDMSMKISSSKGCLKYKTKRNFKNEKTVLYTPYHTAMFDMMDVIGNFDHMVMPIKESLSLDYISQNSLGISKIKYAGNLQTLYEDDFETYVFYNAVDSILVQLIDMKFKTLKNLELQSLFCKIPIEQSVSKIALSEALIYKEYFDSGMVVVPSSERKEERGELKGAFVKQPTPGYYNWITCNDFAALYPSNMRTCNLSFENIIRKDEGEWSETELEKYRSDPNYFVSLRGVVYKNDKDYAIRRIMNKLDAERGKTKYRSKLLDSDLLSLIDKEINKRGL